MFEHRTHNHKAILWLINIHASMDVCCVSSRDTFRCPHCVGMWMCPLHFAAYFGPEFNWHLLTTLPPDDVCNDDDEGEYEDLEGDESDLEYDLDDSEGEYEDCDPDDSEGDY